MERVHKAKNPGMEMEKAIPEKSVVDYVGDYSPTFFGFGTFKHGVRPEDPAL